MRKLRLEDIWQIISELGLHGQNDEESDRNRTFNKIVAISLLTYLIFIPISGIVGSLLYFSIILTSSFLLFLVLYLNHLNWFKFSKVFFLTLLMSSISLISMYLGSRSGVFLCLIPISTLPLLFYRSRISALFPLLICIIMFFVVESYNVFGSTFEFENWKVNLIYFNIVVGVLVVQFFYNLFFKIASDKKDEKYISLNQQINQRNNDIVENIRIARRIQANLLPYDEQFNGLFPNSFVFYLPRDLVSGDFYWVDSVDGKKYCSVIDCTGHGVPGAFVSILGHQALNRCLNDLKLRKPAEILDKLHEFMYQVLRKEDSLILDGMDLSLICIDPEMNLLSFSGAFNSSLLIRENDAEPPGLEAEYRGINHSIYKLNGQKQSVGAENLRESFVQTEIEIRSKDRIYMYTDGYVDQFGGPNDKKLMHKAFKKLLLSVQELDLKRQEEEVRNYFDNWKEDNAQIDDVCVIGIEIE